MDDVTPGGRRCRAPRTTGRSGLAAPSLLALLVLLSSSHSARANESFDSPLHARHRLSLGITEQDTDGGVRATAGEATPVELRLEDFGVEDRDLSFYVDYRYRFGERWSLFAGAYSFADSDERVSSRDFNYNGVDFTVGTRVRTEIEVDAYLVDVMYSAYRRDRFELELGGGIHALDLGASFSGDVQLDGDTRVFRSSGSTLLAPVPNLRASFSWAVNDRLYLTAVAGWLSANVDEYEGDFVYGHLRAFYGITERLGISLGYQRTDIDITQTRARSNINYDLRLNGPTLSLSLAF
jgi:hypothetical protein